MLNGGCHGESHGASCDQQIIITRRSVRNRKHDNSRCKVAEEDGQLPSHQLVNITYAQSHKHTERNRVYYKLTDVLASPIRRRMVHFWIFNHVSQLSI